MTTALALQVTRAEAALGALAKATDRIQRLEQEEAAAFHEYHQAQASCKAEGLTCDYDMAPGLAASYSLFKQDLSRDEAKRIAREETQ